MISITFLAFDLEVSPGCSNDYLTVYDGENWLGDFCNGLSNSGITTTVLASSGNTMEIHFNTDGSTTDAGFAFTVSHVDKPDMCDPNGVTVVHDGAVITSPGYPGSYPDDTDCVWDIVAPSDMNVIYIFEEFHLEKSPLCSKDYLELYVGGSVSKHCGDEYNLYSVTTRESSMRIEFHSDGNVRSTGFRITILFTLGAEDTCSPVPVLLSGQTLSTEMLGPLMSNADCQWTLVAPEQAVWLVYAMSFQLEDDCSADALTIFDDNELYGVFCGTDSPEWLISETNIVYIELITDGSVNLVSESFLVVYENVYPSAYCTEDGNLVVHHGAIITSPNFPDSYPSLARCKWEIRAPPNKVVHLVVNSFDLERNPGCHKDNLTVMDDGLLLGVFCGELGDRQTTLLRSLVSYTRHLKLEFHTDSSVNHHGFSFRVEFVDSSDDVVDNLPVSHDPCSGGMMYITESGHMVSSPNYPGPYPAFLSCNWRIEAPYGHGVRLETQDFRVEYERECHYDALRIYDGVSPQASLIDTYCGVRGDVGVIPENVQSTGSGLYLSFTSDYYDVDGGFLFTVFFTGTAAGSGDNDECSGGVRWIYNDGVTIMSPGFPNSNYPNDVMCRWAIQAPGNQEVYLTVNDFRLEHDPSCTGDSLSIFDGINVEADLIGRYCGSRSSMVPGYFMSSGHALFLQFETDSDDTYRGFSIDVKFSETVECPSEPIELTVEGSILVSPNYPGDYPNYALCEWIITAPPSMFVYLEPVEFSVEREEDCDWDVFVAYDGPSDDSPLIGYFCGLLGDPTLGPTNIISRRSNQMRVVFSSDYIIRDTGFKFIVHFLSTPVVPPAQDPCSGGYVLIEEDGALIQSPNYPMNYPNLIRCSWRISASANQVIMLVAGSFDVEYDSRCSKDHLSVYDGTSTGSRVINRYCGSIGGIGHPPGDVRSTGTDMFVEFTADDLNFRSGFIFSVEFIRPGYPELVDACAMDYAYVYEPTKIYSPNYPDNYPNNADCAWKVQSPQNKLIQVTALVFDLESSGSCSNDYVVLYDGSTTLSPEIDTFCSSTGPVAVTSTSNDMVIHFISSASSTFTGFIIIIDFIDLPPGPVPVLCGMQAILPITPRIAGGKEANPNSWPWIASLRINDIHICSGVVINDQWVLTAGNCLAEAPCAYDVVLGDHNKGNTGIIEQNFGVEKVVVHDAYHGGSRDSNDIGLIKLDASITFIDEIGPVCLPEDMDISSDFTCISIGWGLLTGGSNDLLMQVDLKTINQELCSSDTWLGDDVTESMLCAGQERPGVGTCEGDGGAPLLCRRHSIWAVYGVGSWGDCGVSFQSPSVFTRIHKYINWIHDVVKDSSSTCSTGTVELVATNGRGVATTPNHPLMYPSDLSCAFLVTAPEGRRIQIYFMDFYLEDSLDKVFIYDGEDSLAPLVGEYTNNDNPGNLVSTGDKYFIRVDTDGSGERYGFSFVYYLYVQGELPRPCPLNYTEDAIGCMWFSGDLSLSWADALDRCQCDNPGSRLLEPISSAYLSVADTLRGGEAYWIGAQYVPVYTDYLYTGSTEDFSSVSNFAPSEPDRSGDCLMVQADGTWIDEDCSTTNKFICQLV